MKKTIDIKRTFEIINKFKKTTILVVGDLMIDHYIYGTSTRVSPEAPVPIVDVQYEKIFLGGSGNVINNICEVGGKVYASGVIGSWGDNNGDIIHDILTSKNIETIGIISDPNRCSTLKTRIISNQQQVARYDLESRKDCDLQYTEKILEYINSKKYELDIIIISDYNKGTITRHLMNGILKIVSGTNIQIFTDPKKTDLSFYNGVDIITPNHFEAERCVNNTDINVIGKTLLTNMNFKAVLITRGEKGISLFQKNEKKIIHEYFPSKVVNVSDVSGAGDTVIAIFSLCVASGATYSEATEISNLAAGIVVNKFGTATLTIQELKEYIIESLS